MAAATAYFTTDFHTLVKQWFHDCVVTYDPIILGIMLDERILFHVFSQYVLCFDHILITTRYIFQYAFINDELINFLAIKFFSFDQLHHMGCCKHIRPVFYKLVILKHILHVLWIQFITAWNCPHCMPCFAFYECVWLVIPRKCLHCIWKTSGRRATSCYAWIFLQPLHPVLHCFTPVSFDKPRW